jgi:hypothetical protein
VERVIIHSSEDLLLMPVHQIAPEPFPVEMVVFWQNITAIISKLEQKLHKYRSNKTAVSPACQQSSIPLLCYSQSRMSMMTYWPVPKLWLELSKVHDLDKDMYRNGLISTEHNVHDIQSTLHLPKDI